MKTSVTRRDFVGVVAGAGALPATQASASTALAAEAAAWPKLRPATIYKVYVGRSGAAPILEPAAGFST